MQTAYKSVRLFKSDFLEWFSHIHPLTPLTVWGPIAIWFIWRGITHFGLGIASVAPIAISGLLVWSLAEYVLHRFVFHFKPRGAFQERVVFIMHGIHHADPVDPTRLVMTPTVALVLALIFYPIFYFALPLSAVDVFFGFFIAGYLVYDYTHYAVHHFTPRTRWGKALKQNHMVHHYVTHDVRWGVSSPLWDIVFGSYKEPMPAKKTKSRPTTISPIGTAQPGLKRSAAPGKSRSKSKAKA